MPGPDACGGTSPALQVERALGFGVLLPRGAFERVVAAQRQADGAVAQRHRVFDRDDLDAGDGGEAIDLELARRRGLGDHGLFRRGEGEEDAEASDRFHFMLEPDCGEEHKTSMNSHAQQSSLIGVGLYTPAEAGRLIGVASQKITRWLRGHSVGERAYEPLWAPQVDLEDGSVHLGFRDLIEARAANEFIRAGLSPQAVRRAIQLARDEIGIDRPLSTTAFKTDGKSIFLEQIGTDGEVSLLDLFKGQFAFAKIMQRSLKGIEFDGIEPTRWRPMGDAGGIVIDPEKAFGQPISEESGIPTAVLKAAFDARGNTEAVARDWEVPVRVVRQAIAFETPRVLETAA